MATVGPSPNEAFLGLNQRRQLDQHRFLAKGIGDLRLLAIDTQVLIFRALAKEANRIIQLEETDKGVKTLGLDRLRMMMLAKKKQRWYDQHPVAHQAMSQVYCLAQTEQKRMGVYLFLSVQATQQYIKQCTTKGRHVSYDAIQSIAETIFQWDTQSLQQRYRALLQQPRITSDSSPNSRATPSEPKQAPVVTTTTEATPDLKTNSNSNKPRKRITWVDDEDTEDYILRGKRS